MGRVVRQEALGTQRRKLMQALALALRELVTRTGVDAETRDLVAFVVLTLRAIAETVQETTAAWEKRGYWVKADRFRLEWAWSEQLARALDQALRAEDWGEITRLALALYPHVSEVKLPKRKRPQRPWEGAWAQWQGASGEGLG